MIDLGVIVEGQGDEKSVGVLIRRIYAASDSAAGIRLSPLLRVQKERLLKPAEFERTVDFVARDAQRILILLDADDDCPAERGPELLARAQAVRRDREFGIVLANREYEAWFLAAAASIAGHRGLPIDLQPPAASESIRGAKEWLSARMGPRRGYTETTDQLELTKIFDMEVARQRSDSFDKCYREIERLLRG